MHVQCLPMAVGLTGVEWTGIPGIDRDGQRRCGSITFAFTGIHVHLIVHRRSGRSSCCRRRASGCHDLRIRSFDDVEIDIRKVLEAISGCGGAGELEVGIDGTGTLEDVATGVGLEGFVQAETEGSHEGTGILGEVARGNQGVEGEVVLGLILVRLVSS